jgi:NDP-hexose 4-ketoreductase
MTRVLVFGAAGFIGKQVCHALTADSRVAQVIPAGRAQHDLANDSAHRLTDLLTEARPDVVVNCAGKLAGTDAELVAANTFSVAKLIGSVAGRRLVTLGSAAEYGIVEPGRPVRETDYARPVSSYGITRLAATRLVDLAVAEGRLDGLVLRVFNPIGPGLPAENVAGQAVRKLRRALEDHSGRIRLGPLGAYRDFVDVRDVAAAVVAAVFGVRPGVYNVGSGRAVPTRELIRLLCDAAGFAGTVEEADPPSVRSRGVDWIAADLSHTTTSLQWKPAYDLTASAYATWLDS